MHQLTALLTSAFCLTAWAPLALAAPSPQHGAPGGAPQAMPVKALRLTTRNLTLHQELPGRINAYELAEIRPQVSGIIKARGFEEGSRVEAGSTLYQIDPAPYKAAYDRAAADLARAKALLVPIEARLARFEGLVKLEAVSRQEYDDAAAAKATAEADIAIAEAALATAEINLTYTKVLAPISGIIGKSHVTKGALATAGQAQALSVITQLDPIYADISQPNADLVRLRRRVGDIAGIAVELLLDDAGLTYERQGSLLFHEVSVDESTSTVKLRAKFPNPDHLLLPGQFVRARLILPYPDALLVPQRAAQRGPDGQLRVWLVDGENKATPVVVQADRAYEDAWIITDGVKAGDVIVLQGQQNLQPGAPVAPNFAEAGAEAHKNGE